MMKKINIWFNHWFSTAYHIINLIKQDNDTEFHIIGTSRNPDSVVKNACDEWYSEPDTHGREYIDFCLDFCKEHNIDIFAPRFNQLDVCRHADEFEKINVKLLADSYDKISFLHDKAKAYNLFTEKNIGYVPDYRIVRTAEEFEKGFKELSENHEKLCLKFTSDEGATSFRIIDSEPLGPFQRAGNHIDYQKAVADISWLKGEKEIMLMPLLSGNEVSADCLQTQNGTIIIPRFKTNTRTEYIRHDPRIISACKDFFEKFGLDTPCNIQFIYHNDIPYFLEINTRMSGGIQLTCMASGVNIPNIAVNKLLGIQKPWHMPEEEVKITHIETPVILK